jgi:hypothetical protein
MNPIIRKTKEKCEMSGYIALISVIIISVLLMGIALVASMDNFFARYNTLDDESKNISSELAEACVSAELNKLAVNPKDTSVGVVAINQTYSCNVVSVMPNSPSNSKTTIKTYADVNHAVTNLKIIVNLPSLSLYSWEETP